METNEEEIKDHDKKIDAVSLSEPKPKLAHEDPNLILANRDMVHCDGTPQEVKYFGKPAISAFKFSLVISPPHHHILDGFKFQQVSFWCENQTAFPEQKLPGSAPPCPTLHR